MTPQSIKQQKLGTTCSISDWPTDFPSDANSSMFFFSSVGYDGVIASPAAAFNVYTLLLHVAI